MESPVQEGEMLAGKYRVEKVLGFGGMGVVVSALHGELEQRVAVKFLGAAAAERSDAAERFRREARAVARIKSDHVARILDVGMLDTGLPYMVMEYLDGNDIAAELQQRGVLEITESIEIVLQAVEALAEAHAAGIVHRDLKPGNLYLARRSDGSRRVKILDFGISKAMTGGSVPELSLTKTAALIGSPLYMSPEQMRSARDVDTRADIWSLGVMLYEMLSGRLPYIGDSIPQLCASLLNDAPLPLRELRPEVPLGVERAILRCLEKDPEARFQNVFELGRALLPFAPESRIHVERAERMLGATELTLSVPARPREREVETGPTVMEPTVNSWGNSQSAPDAGPRRRKRLLLVGALAAVVAGALGLVAARGRHDAGTAAAGSVAPAAVFASSSAPTAHPAPTLAATQQAPTVATRSPAAQSARVEAAAPLPKAPPVLVRPNWPPKVQAETAPPSALPPASKLDSKAPPPVKAGADITDFGGRR